MIILTALLAALLSNVPHLLPLLRLLLPLWLLLISKRHVHFNIASARGYAFATGGGIGFVFIFASALNNEVFSVSVKGDGVAAEGSGVESSLLSPRAVEVSLPEDMELIKG